MYAALCNIPQALGWENFEFPQNYNGNEKDDWGTRLKVVDSIVQRIAELRGFPIKEIKFESNVIAKDKRVLVRLNKDPFASPASTQDRVIVPSSWLLHTNDLSKQANPSSRDEMKKNPSWIEPLFQFLQKTTATLEKGPTTLFQKIEAEETWLIGHKLSGRGLDRSSLALVFMIQHELGHVHHNHSANRDRHRKQACFAGAAAFLAVAFIGARVSMSARKVPLAIGFGVLALGSGVLTKTLSLSRLARKQEREADLFATSAGEPSLRQNTISGGIVLFQVALESGREAIKHHKLRKILFDDEGNTRYFFDLEHPPSTKRLRSLKLAASQDKKSI
ncbi:MAG: M48 family metalloprotease [Verrucomicrobia bacterium]|nr:M48 family metalloprotease [Verrucomicrobiota bacterium]